tara:strand:+ start:748 stop:1386 length:639 start_codon:yes stop_codon:yes gene_type:complete
MALRILPFRQYSDHDVVNLYAVDDYDVNDNTIDSGRGDAGMFVKVSAGNFDADPITYQDNSYLGKRDYPFLGTAEMYPQVNLTITGSTSGEIPLGLTLFQTAKNDENGQKLLYNPEKQLEAQAILPGQATPVATKGIFTLAQAAFDGNVADYTPGRGIRTSLLNAGKITGALRSDGIHVFGHVLGTGHRGNVGNTTDQFSGDYLVVSFDCNR